VEFAAAERPVVPKAACDVQFCAVEIELPQNKECQDAGRDTAAGEPDHRGPVDAFCKTVRQAATGLGGSGKQEIGADRRRRVDSEQQDQQWCHERSAAHTRHADQ